METAKEKGVILDLAVTLDGFIEGPNGEIDWCILDDEMDLPAFLQTVDTIFYGRVSYDAWGNFQPAPDAPPADQALWKSVHSKNKVVFTRQKPLPSAGSQERQGPSPTTTFVHGDDLLDRVAAVKAQGGRDIWLYGGASLTKTFLEHKLVDTFRLSVHPVVLGRGKPLFGDLASRLDLTLASSRAFRSGVVQLIYHLRKCLSPLQIWHDRTLDWDFLDTKLPQAMSSKLKVVESVTDLVGGTPILKLGKSMEGTGCNVYAKLENCNPMSIKDRPAKKMLELALKGNTAIGLAQIGTLMGFKVKIFMTDAANKERRQILLAFGAEIFLTPAAEGVEGAKRRLLEYCAARPDTTYFISQHTNAHNALSHYEETGPEIWEQLGGRVDIVVLGLGTCGHYAGLSQYFREKNPQVQIIGFEPAASPVYSGGKMAKHKLTGIGPGFVTDNYRRVAPPDEILLIGDDEAYEWVRKVALDEALLVGVTSGAGACAARRIAERPESAGKNLVFLVYDSGERYLSTEGLFTAEPVTFVP